MTTWVLIMTIHPIFWCGVTVGLMIGGLFMKAIRVFFE